VIAHALVWCEEAGWEVGETCCIYPAVPMIQVEDLYEALALLHASSATYSFPVAAFPSAVQRALRRLPDGRVEPFDPEQVRTRSQDLETGYYDAGQFYWGWAHAWLRGLDVHRNGVTIELPRWRVADIDTPEDWRHAELLYRAAGLENDSDRVPH
jgi:CMP-N-acetylneuraminic acid synthetase